MRNKGLKVCLVGSSGGHLNHLYRLKPFWEDKERFWATFDKEDARSQLKGETIYPVYYPSNRSIKALIINTHRTAAAFILSVFFIGSFAKLSTMSM